MAQVISTIGYEGSTINSFVEALLSQGIKLLIDVRELPLSRKKGFSKNQLADYLEANGIQYLHLRGLGDPKDGRNAARTGDYKAFLKIFNKHMKTEAAQHDLQIASKLVKKHKSCLMCYECDHTQCHRSIVAASLADSTGLTIRDLKVQNVPVKIFARTVEPSYAYA